jgi:cyclopropane-fatty-acyl-phospholipid synthase
MNTHVPVRGRHMAASRPGFLARCVGQAFHLMLDRIDAGMTTGAIECLLPDGAFRVLGGRGAGPTAQLTVFGWRAFLRLAQGGSEGWYQAWQADEWASGDPVVLFEVLMRNRKSLGNTTRASPVTRVWNRLSFWRHRNNRAGAKRNILAHYDLGNDFYRLWLDDTMTYSSALFQEPIGDDESLENAQHRKVQALLERLNLTPQSTLLEIGSGWGYLSRACAENGHQVTAVTLSPSQKAYSEHAATLLSKPPKYHLQDYRDVTGCYDAIASVEMVEAVGQAYWPSYLDTIGRCLKPSGRAAIQYIAIADDVFEAYASSMDFIQTHIFPGGLLISESKFKALAHARGLTWEDPTHFGLHYAETLRRWRLRFDCAVDEGRLPKGFDARFVKLWRYYLMYCEGGFRSGGITVAQVTLVKQ